MSGIIIGAGISGLCAAIALRRQGIETRVFDSAREIKPVGAGIELSPNALAALERMDLLSKVEERGLPLDAVRLSDARGRVLMSVNSKDLKSRFGHGLVALHGAELHQALVSELPADTITLRKCATSCVIDPEATRVVFEDNAVERGDFVIGADGLNSVVRSHLFPASRLRYSGQTSWRGVTRFTFPASWGAEACEYWAGDRRFGFAPLNRDQVYWYAIQVTSENGADPGTGARPLLADLFGDLPAPAPDLIASTAEEEIARFDLHDLRPLEHWFKGRGCLVGDAAHAATPNLGQGGAQAIEDAWILARAMAKGSRVEEAFAEYERVRKPRADWVTVQSWKLGKLAHWRMAGSRAFRDFALRHLLAGAVQRRLERAYRLRD